MARRKIVEDNPETAVDETVWEPPVIERLDPASANVGGDDVTLHVIGRAFTETCVILFNAGEEPTTFVSEAELTTILKPSLASGQVTVPVQVRDGEVYSDPVDFSFLEYIPPDPPPVVDPEDPDVVTGTRMAGAAAMFDQPNISARTMLLDPRFWAAMIKAQREPE